MSCTVCGTWGAAIRPLASRQYPLCDRCYGHWYEGDFAHGVPVATVVRAWFSYPSDDLGKPIQEEP